MAIEGQIVLFKFPQTDLTIGKLRPALLIRKLSNGYDDWLAYMISTQRGQEVIGLDETISPNDQDFKKTGLKLESIVRVSRLAVVSEKIMIGKIGKISEERLGRIKRNLASWILTS